MYSTEFVFLLVANAVPECSGIEEVEDKEARISPKEIRNVKSVLRQPMIPPGPRLTT